MSGHIDYKGLDGVKTMVELTLMAIPDCKFTHHGGMKHGRLLRGGVDDLGNRFNTEFACRGASVGETDDDGRIVHNRDYWDSRSFPEMPAGPDNPDLEELQASAIAEHWRSQQRSKNEEQYMVPDKLITADCHITPPLRI